MPGIGGSAAEARRTSRQLPPGRHGLPRSFVIQNQRERMLSAVAEASADLGYAEMTVESIIARAGVSRRTFYAHFKNKEEAFLAAYDAAVGQLISRVRRAYLGERGVRDRLRAGLEVYLEFWGSEPAFARLCIVEVLAAGPRALQRRNAAMRDFTSVIEENIKELMPRCTAPQLAAETIVGGIHEVVYTRILDGRTGELPGLAPDLLNSILMLGAGALRRRAGEETSEPAR